MGFEVSRVNHHSLLLTVISGQYYQHLGEDTFVTPPLPAVVRRLTVPYAALENTAATITVTDKLVIDCTNLIAMGPDGMGLAVGHTTSDAEQLQAMLPDAHLMKTLNQVGQRSWPTPQALRRLRLSSLQPTMRRPKKRSRDC